MRTGVIFGVIGMIWVSGCSGDDQTNELLLATIHHDKEKVQRLINEGADVNAVYWEARTGKRTSTALASAAGLGYTDIVELLIAHGADVNRGGPLDAAAECNQLGTARILLDHGARITQGTSARNTSFWVAASQGYAEMTELLLEYGADVNEHDGGDTPLVWAVMGGHKEVVRTMIAHDVNVNMTSREDGKTPLNVAVENGDYEIVRMLLDAGANTTVTNARGETPLRIAERIESKAIADILKEHGAKD